MALGRNEEPLSASEKIVVGGDVVMLEHLCILQKKYPRWSGIAILVRCLNATSTSATSSVKPSWLIPNALVGLA
jgi:hypothetical protein